MDKQVFTLELSEAERNFLLAAFEAGVAAMGINTLVGKLRSVAPAVAQEPQPQLPAAE